MGRSRERVNRPRRPESQGQSLSSLDYPFTSILEKDSMARPDVGAPIDVAGRNVVKISMFFTCGERSFGLRGPESIR